MEAVTTKLECEEYLISQGINRDLKQDYWNWFRGTGNIEKDIQSTLKETTVRADFIQKYGFGILCRSAIEAMRPYAPILEIGAGSGYWSHELQWHGIDAIATDPGIGEYSFWGPDHAGRGRWNTFYTEVQTIDCYNAVRKYPERNLLTCWPDYDDPWAADAISIFTGNTVIYMGEGYGNATADDRFHEILESVFSDQIHIRMPHFWGNYDRWLIIASKPKQLIERSK